MIETDTPFLSDVTAGRRLSESERRALVSELERSRTEGRLTSEEFSERAARVRSAQVRGDLRPIFADLPEPRLSQAARRTSFPRFGVMLIALSPFVAVALFFLTGMTQGWTLAWLWFLLVPVTAIIVNGLRGAGE